MYVTQEVNVKKKCDNGKKKGLYSFNYATASGLNSLAQLMLNHAKAFQPLMDCKLAFNKRVIIVA